MTFNSQTSHIFASASSAQTTIKRVVGTLIITGFMLTAASSPALATPSNGELHTRLKTIEKETIPGLNQQINQLGTELSSLSDRVKRKVKNLTQQLNAVEQSLRSEMTELSGVVEGRSPSRFTIISSSNIRLNDSQDKVKLKFNLPDVDVSKGAILLYNTKEVDFTLNRMLVNGVSVSGAVTPTPIIRDENLNTLKANVALVGGTQHKLRNSGNTLEIEARDKNGNAGTNIEDFSIDNIVILYQAK